MIKHLVFPLFALLLVSGCAKTVPVEQYDVKAKEADALTAQNGSLQAQVKSLTADVASLKKEQEMTRMEKEALQTKVDQLSQKAEKAEQLEKATQTYQDLQKKLEKEIQEGQVQIKEMKDRLTVTMVDQILFPSGSAEVGKKGKAVLDKVVTILKDVKDKRIEVDGHTDNVPIVSSLKKRFPTNWELSTARATEVVRYLQETGGIDPHLLSATGFAEYMPVAANDTEEGKHKNRRIEIVLLPLLK
ncbi:MAG TPA: flagellar motor protein MotB [Nitrospirota bacterium]|nr:flagellar motor protein MotB [Nitrospirota bacterium]